MRNPEATMPTPAPSKNFVAEQMKSQNGNGNNNVMGGKWLLISHQMRMVFKRLPAQTKLLTNSIRQAKETQIM